jgi:hypothetical protein
MKCTSCGADIAPNSSFCTHCGTAVENTNQTVTDTQETPAVTPEQPYQQNPYHQQQAQYQPYQQQYQQPNYVNNNWNGIPSDYKPISAWGYVGYNLLFSIPLVGFILLFVYGFGNGNINVKNYARSFLLFYLITIVLTILLSVLFAGAFGAIANQYM